MKFEIGGRGRRRKSVEYTKANGEEAIAREGRP